MSSQDDRQMEPVHAPEPEPPLRSLLVRTAVVTLVVWGAATIALKAMHACTAQAMSSFQLLALWVFVGLASVVFAYAGSQWMKTARGWWLMPASIATLYTPVVLLTLLSSSSNALMLGWGFGLAANALFDIPKTRRKPSRFENWFYGVLALMSLVYVIFALRLSHGGLASC